MSEEKEKPNYYGILTADVRYDKNISANAKLLFVEITCILNHNNRCFASNSYFARVFEISEVQVSRLIKQLIDNNYIIVDYKKTLNGTSRYISISKNINSALINNDNCTLIKNDSSALINNDKYNINSTNNNRSTKVDKRAKKINKFIPPSEQEVVDYFKEKGYLEESAKKAFEYYETGEWKDSKGTPVKNWKQKMISVWFKEENKSKEVKQNKIVF